MSDRQALELQPQPAAPSKDFFFGVFENAPLAMAIVCPESLTIQAANRKFCDLTGYSAAELADREVTILVSGKDALRYSDELAGHARSNNPAGLTRRVQYSGRNGHAIRVAEAVTKVAAPPPAADYLLITVEDPSAQPGLATILTAFLEHTADEVWAVGPDNRILLANQAFCKRHDIPASRIGSVDSGELIRDQSPADMSMHRAVLETGNTRRQILSYALPDGQREMYSTVKFPIDLGNEDAVAVGTVATNISAISRSATELRDRDDQIRQITDSLHILIFRLDENLHFKYMNQAVAKWWNVEADDLVGKHYSEVVGAETFEQRRPYLEQAMTGKTVTHSTVVTHPDGNTRHINVTFIPHRSAPGKPYGLIGLIEDVTERKRIEDQLAQASKLEGIGQLAAGIAHEINTPIQFIGDNLGFLRDASEGLFDLVRAFTDYIAAIEAGTDPTKARNAVNDAIADIDLDFLKEDVPDAIERSLQGVKDVARIVLSMKDFSHPNNKERTPVNVNRALRNTLTISRNEWKHVAEVEENLDEALPQILGFPGELNQVFLNIIVNAAHAITEKGGTGLGTIGVGTRVVDNHVEIRISDTGTGIPKALRERIFEPFFTTKEVGKGTGQGLAISWDIIVNKHGGTIEIESEPDEGTTFILTLPS